MARRNLEGLRIVITGASQGIGKALALEAAKRGMNVVASARSADLLYDLAAEAKPGMKGSLATVVADVTEASGRQAMLQCALNNFGGVDVIVNNAGVGATGHFAEGSAETLRKIMEVNYFGLAETTRIFIPELKKSSHAAIVNISSIAGKRGIPARSDYSASKFAVQGFSNALRAELAKDNIDVLVVCPGLTQTNFSKNMIEQKAKMKMDHMRGMTSEEVAVHTLRSIEIGRNEVSLTANGKLMSFVSRFFPRLADRIAKRKVIALFKEEMAQRRIKRQELKKQQV